MGNMSSMELFAVFETWHLGDGNYPAPEKGQLVNLSFELSPDELTVAEGSASLRFQHVDQALYEFTGEIIRVYGTAERSDRIVVLETDGFRFYINSDKALHLKCGETVSGKGTLLYDHYIWVEFLSDYPDPPNLFYTLRISQIWRYRIPERFIHRSERVTSYPTRVNLEEYASSDISVVESVPWGGDGFENYVVQLTDHEIPELPVPHTFFH